MGNATILERVTLAGLQTMEHRRGIAWNGTLTLDGAPFAVVSQDGRGGCNDYNPADGSNHRAMRETLETLETAAREATGARYEAFDELVCFMGYGGTAADAVACRRGAMEPTPDDGDSRAAWIASCE